MEAQQKKFDDFEKVQCFNSQHRSLSSFVIGCRKIILDCVGFALLRSVIVPENSFRPLDQSDSKLKPIASWPLVFSRALGCELAFTLRSYWLLVIFSSPLIGCCDFFGFWFYDTQSETLDNVQHN